MTAGVWEVVFFCLASGAALGTFYALVACFGVLLRAGRWLTGALDIGFCLVCAAVVFLAALAVDHGRLRFFQAALQLLGGWSAAAVFTPLFCGGARKLQKFFARMSGFLQRKTVRLLPHWRTETRKRPQSRKKVRKKGKKAQKRA